MFDLSINCAVILGESSNSEHYVALASLSMVGVFCNLSVFGWFPLGLLSGVVLHNWRGDAFLGYEIY